MAEQGENYIKHCFEEQGYKIDKLGNEDVFGIKENLGVVVEEKDWKDQVKVYRNKIYQLGKDGKWYYHLRNQVVNYGYRIKQRDMQLGIYRFIVCAMAFSNLQGRRVQPIYFRKFGTIFIVSKEYFPIWLKSLERTYLGMPVLEDKPMYTGGI